MPWTKEDRSFKTLINRRSTSDTKAYYEEFGDLTINVHVDEIWDQFIDSTPAQAVTDGVAELKTLFVLTEDTSVPSQQGYYADQTGTRLKDWISEKYGSSYRVKLYENDGTEIFPADTSDWFFDYQTGILTFNGSTAGFAKPFKITGYRYIGIKGPGGIAPIASDTTAGIAYIANNNQFPTVGPTSLRADDSRVLKWDGVNTHGFPGDATVAGDATVVGGLDTARLTVDGMAFPTADSTSPGSVLATDATGQLYWTEAGDALAGAQVYQIYDVTSASPTIFYLSDNPVNPYAVTMQPEGGIQFTNSIDFSVSSNVVTYLSSPAFESGDRIIFQYLK